MSIKPTSILLDDEMNAHVGDFGMASIMTKEERRIKFDDEDSMDAWLLGPRIRSIWPTYIQEQC
jgi:serine/threonine protein kinase